MISAAAGMVSRARSAWRDASVRQLLWIGALLRLALVIWGQAQDALLEVKYTDVDYRVFTDAARHLAAGRSPYDRATYRYTPLLAALLIPNVWIPPFGKLLFSACDILVAVMLDAALPKRGSGLGARKAAVAAWLFNPYTAAISTRGNGESLVAVMIYGALACLDRGAHLACGALLGLAAHWRIYPAAFLLPAALHVGQHLRGPRRVFNARTITLAASGVAAFLAAGALCLAWQGTPFLLHAFLHHAARLDHRHNFAPAFLPSYLRLSLAARAPASPALSLAPLAAAALPVAQLTAVAALGARFHADPPFAMAAQAAAFVALNRVSTAQYFVWFLSLLPMAVTAAPALPSRAVHAALAWAASQAAWLAVAYCVEFQGIPAFNTLWAASLVFQGCSVWVLVELCLAHPSLPPLPEPPSQVMRQREASWPRRPVWKGVTEAELKKRVREAQRAAKAAKRRERGQGGEGEQGDSAGDDGGQEQGDGAGGEGGS